MGRLEKQNRKTPHFSLDAEIAIVNKLFTFYCTAYIRNCIRCSSRRRVVAALLLLLLNRKERSNLSVGFLLHDLTALTNTFGSV